MDLPLSGGLTVPSCHRILNSTLGHDLITDNQDREATAMNALGDGVDLAGCRID